MTSSRVPGPPPPTRRVGDTRATAPARLALPVLDAAALTVLLLAVLRSPPALVGDPAATATVVLLVVAAVLHAEVVRTLDRRRRLDVRRPHVEAAATWSFAAVLLLGLPLALVVTAVVSAAAWWRSWQRRPARVGVAMIAVSVLATAGSGLVLATLPPDVLRFGPVGPAVVLAGLARWAVHAVLTVVVAAAAPCRGTWPSPASTRVELALSAAATGVGLAAAEIAVRSPWVLGVLVLPLAAIHRETQLHELGRVAATDEKTELATAAAWRRHALRLLVRARRRRGGPRAVGVLMIDLDDFKVVNDRHGHLVGDAVLGAVARALRSELRTVDVAGRFGGEEFVVALADLAPRDAPDRCTAVAERIRRRVRTMTVELEGPDVITDLSVSVGVAVHPADGDTLDDLVLAADAALYTAKRTGRNRVCRAGEESA